MGNDLASTLEDCYKRSKAEFGTSKVWPDKLEGSLFNGILDFSPAHSKFANWTKIVFMYCDGAFHQGNNRGPIQYKDTLLYFRGAVNTRSHLKWAESKYALSKAEKVVVSGSSAGGIATYLWVDHIRTLVSDPQVVSGVVDSGIFYDPLVNLQAEIVKTEDEDQPFKVIRSNLLSETADSLPIQFLMKLSNVDERPPNKECSGLLTQE